jgi:hypothetical protein
MKKPGLYFIFRWLCWLIGHAASLVFTTSAGAIFPVSWSAGYEKKSRWRYARTKLSMTVRWKMDAFFWKNLIRLPVSSEAF